MLKTNGTVRVVSHGTLGTTKAGKPMAYATVVSSRTWTDSNGEAQEDTTFLTVFAFGNLAKSLATRVPGELLAIEAELNERTNVSERHARLDEHGRIERIGVQFKNYTLTARNIEYLTSRTDREKLVQKHGLPEWQRQAEEAAPAVEADTEADLESAAEVLNS